MAPKNFFIVKLTTERKPWPFTWGPFRRGKRTRVFKVHSASVGIYQRTGHELTRDGIGIECLPDAGNRSCCTTVWYQGHGHLRRRTGVSA
jgi:hypothetical protein